MGLRKINVHSFLVRSFQKRTVDAQRSFVQIQRYFLGRMKNGRYFVAKCCQGAGLGGASGRDGSFDYYISENVISYDLKATGAYLQAACEEQLLREGKCAYDGQSIGLSL